MSVLLYGAIAFVLAFVVHLLLWKFRLPRKSHIDALLKIFFGVLFISILIFILSPNTFFLGIKFPQTFVQYLELFLFYSSLTLVYITTYSAVEVDSPSLVIILSIAEVAPDGLEKEKLFRVMTDDILVIPRINDLVRDKMVFMNKDKIKLAPKGIFFVTTIILFRKLLNIPKGG